MILSCGDALIDFVPVRAADGREAVRPAVGGSCLNIAVGLARLGIPSGFVGGISTDLFGRMIADHAAASKVDLRHATRTDHQTTLAFVRLIVGESQYAFYDAGTASANWTYRRGSIAFDAIDAVHIGSTTLVHDRKAYRARMGAFAANADVVRMSDVDFEYLFGEEDFAARAAALLATGPSLVVVTRGTNGALAWHRAVGAVEVGAPTVDVVDTIGAGDSFQAALLFALRQLGRIERSNLQTIGAADLRRALSFACKCAALTCTRAGADPPRRNEASGFW